MSFILHTPNTFVLNSYTIFEFDTLTNANSTISGDATSVNDWNTWFNLPTNGTPYTNLSYEETLYSVKITLYGGANIKLSTDNANVYFYNYDIDCFLSIEDFGCITQLEGYIFYDCEYMKYAILPYVTDILSENGGYSEVFYCCYSLHYLDLGSLTNIVDDEGNGYWCYDVGDSVGHYVTLRIPSALLTNNNGDIDADLVYLLEENEVGIILSDIGGFQLAVTDTSSVDTWISGDCTLVADWNTFFNLPTNGNVFTSVTVVEWSSGFNYGVTICLQGGGNNTMKTDAFYDWGYLMAVYDTDGVFVTLGYECFAYSYNGSVYITFVHFPNVSALIDSEQFYECEYLTYVYMPKLGAGLTSDNYYAFEYCFYNYFSRFVLDWDAITFLPSEFFYGCDYWEGAITLPNLTQTSGSAFNSCGYLTSISCPLLEVAYSGDFASLYTLIYLYLPSVTSVGSSSLSFLYSLSTLSLPLCTTVSTSAFYSSTGLANLSLPSCTDLGGTVGNDNVFLSISGRTITLTIPAALMTCNGGNPDGDIAYLQANNSVTVIQV